MHFYSFVICKNSACKAESAVKYLGRRKRVLNAKDVREKTFHYECPQCHNVHSYDIAETVVKPLEFPPPVDWGNTI
jgi:hypothetical protein